MDDRLLTIAVTAGFLIFLAVIVGIIQLRSRRGPCMSPLDQARHDRLVSMGIRTEDGQSTCVVCRLRATEYAPITGVSWMDKFPLLNRLYSLAPRHVIVDNVDGDLCYCALHRQLAVAILDEAHAQMRADRARFNAAQAQRVIALDGGEVLQLLIEKHRDHMRLLGLSETPLPQLRAYDEAIATSVVSSTSMVPEEE